MQRTIIPILCVLSLPLQFCTIFAKAPGSWCNATAREAFGSITCHFKEDLQIWRRNFTVQQQRLNSSFFDPVLTCSWTRQASLRCRVDTSYSFNEKVTDRFDLIIPHATSARHDGQYVCQLLPNVDDDIVEPCELNIAGIPDAPSEIQVVNTTFESITLCWKAPPDKGEQLHYQIRYKPATSGTENNEIYVYRPEIHCYSIAGLTPGLGYNISIAALNKFGSSAYGHIGKSVHTLELYGMENNGYLALVVVFFILFFLSSACLVALICCICRKKQNGQSCFAFCVGFIRGTDSTKGIAELAPQGAVRNPESAIEINISTTDVCQSTNKLNASVSSGFGSSVSGPSRPGCSLTESSGPGLSMPGSSRPGSAKSELGVHSAKYRSLLKYFKNVSPRTLFHETGSFDTRSSVSNSTRRPEQSVTILSHSVQPRNEVSDTPESESSVCEPSGGGSSVPVSSFGRSSVPDPSGGRSCVPESSQGGPSVPELCRVGSCVSEPSQGGPSVSELSRGGPSVSELSRGGPSVPAPSGDRSSVPEPSGGSSSVSPVDRLSSPSGGRSSVSGPQRPGSESPKSQSSGSSEENTELTALQQPRKDKENPVKRYAYTV